MSVWTDVMIGRLRSMAEAGESQMQSAAAFGVSQPTIQRHATRHGIRFHAKPYAARHARRAARDLAREAGEAPVIETERVEKARERADADRRAEVAAAISDAPHTPLFRGGWP